MALRPTPAAEELLRRQARRVELGLALYLLVLLLVGIGVLRLAFTARRFERVTVTPVEQPAVETAAGPDDSADEVVVPVSSVVP
jgi:hypothetical protein